MTICNGNAPLVQPVDEETIRTLASLPVEKQALVKGFILGLCSRVAQPASRQVQAGT